MSTEENKIALITGASRGIGKAIAQNFAEQGIYVIGTATSDKGAQAISQNLGSSGQGVVLDIASSESCQALFDLLKAEDKAPDILVNNAGITKDNLFLRMKEDEWYDVINTNLNSVYRITKLFLRAMLKKRWGRIINISSVTALMGNPGQANYAAAKAGMIGFTKSLALEVASRSITVNAVAPGFIATDMTNDLPEAQRMEIDKLIPIGSMGQAEDIAASVAFLASDGAKYITGETIQVSGGLYIR